MSPNKFLTTMVTYWKAYPNISYQSGVICVDFWKDQWSPAMTLRTALLSLQSLLSAPEPGEPLEPMVARQYLEDYRAFVSMVRATKFLAKYSLVGLEKKVQKLAQWGVSEDFARATLESVDGDYFSAFQKLQFGGFCHTIFGGFPRTIFRFFLALIFSIVVLLVMLV
ncbi:hypothetical protein L1049_006615 [Liquidambar formosana]|uniref:UBC core domain-containing protein n=1 Tax=Liquidambar formosana TaxID=63359 RepID=A0AAP0WTZ2_LIQFO